MFLVVFLNPFECFYRTLRYELIFCMAHNIIAPFGYVRFKEFFFGDILTSLVKPMIDFYFMTCFFSTDAWTNSKLITQCQLSNTAVLIISYIPFHIRFWQCINRYFVTGQWFPHLVNAGKYLSTIIVLFAAYFKNTYHKYDHLYVLLYLFSTIYSFTWDITMDWGLMRGTKPGKKLLRDKIKYPKSFYYFSMITNFFLRFAWTLTLIPE